MLREDIMTLAEEEGLLTVDGFDDCIIGIGSRCSFGPVLIYDEDKIVQALVDRDSMTWAEAREFYEFNILGAYMGEKTPLFVTLLEN